MGIMPQFAKVEQLWRAGVVPGHAHVWIFRHREDGDFDAEIGVLVSAPFADRDGLVATRTPAGRAVHAVHIGDYGKLRAVHAALDGWCRDQGQVGAGVNWEVYSELDQDQSKRRTDVYHLLR
jgi:effector-binding domain-containing protein